MKVGGNVTGVHILDLDLPTYLTGAAYRSVEDKERFEKKLGKIAGAKPTGNLQQ